MAWESMPDPRPRVALEIFTPTEVNLLHRIWLDANDKLQGEEIHHHDIIHFALSEIDRAIAQNHDSTLLERLRDHLREIKSRRLNS